MKKIMTNREMMETVNRIILMQDREEKNKEKIFGDRITVNYAVKKNKDMLIQVLKPCDEARKELLEECNKKEAQLNDRIDIKNDCKEKWKKSMDELLGIEVEVDVRMIKLSDIEGLKLSTNDLEAIDFMIEEPENLRK